MKMIVSLLAIYRGMIASRVTNQITAFAIVYSTSIPGPFLKLVKGKGPGIGWSHDTENIWV